MNVAKVEGQIRSVYDYELALLARVLRRDVAALYKVYKNLTGVLVFSYLFAGDYGVQQTSGGATLNPRDFDDTWALFFLMKYTF